MVKEIEKRIEEGIRADGSCSFDPFEVGIALEFALMVLEMHGRSTEKQLTVRSKPAIIMTTVS